LVPISILYSTAYRSVTSAALIGGTGIGLVALVLSWWIPWTMAQRFGAEVPAATAIWLIGALSHVPAGMLTAALSRWVGLGSPLYPLLVGLAWGTMELSWEIVWPGLPSWMVVGATQIDMPVAPIAAWVGVYGVTAIVVAGSAAVLQLLVVGRTAAWGIGPTALVLTLAVGAAGFMQTPPRPEANGQLAIIQPGTPMPSAGESSTYQRRVLDSLIEQTRALSHSVDFVLWPEGALLDALGDRPDLLREIQALVDEKNLPLVLGVTRRAGKERRVSAALLRPGQRAAAVYDKRKLVPFSEGWPSWAPVSARRHLGSMAPVRTPSPGTGLASAASLLPFDLSLCWESAFSTAIAPSPVGTLVNLVNDGWYDDTPTAAQMLLLSRWRTIEHGAWLVRAATTGVSAIISPDGDLVASLGLQRQGVLLAPLLASSPTTPFERWGYRPMAIVLLILAGLSLPGLLIRRSGPSLRQGSRT
jgi:apolipoprotein N-acyltransferase